MKANFRHISLFTLVCISIMFGILLCTNTITVDAANLQNLKTGSGGDLLYRNSSEKVKALSAFDYPTQEYRAAWVSTFAGDLPVYTSKSKYMSDVSTIFDNMQEMGMNAVVFHIRTHNNALYKSQLNPVASWWGTVNFDEFDPLAWTIEEAHKRGLEFHAWLNPYRIRDEFVSGEYPAANPASNPANILTSTSGAKILDPGLPNVRKFIVDTCMEVIENYDVDAIHFDDYFYIQKVDDTATYNKYNTDNLSLPDFRRQQVDLFIENLSKTMHEYNVLNNRAVQLGISPSGIYQNGGYVANPSYDSNGNLISPIASNTAGFSHYGDYLYSDTKKWVDEEWIDYITPQAYWGLEHTAASFAALTRWWSWAVKYKDVNLYMGVGIYMPLETGTSAGYWQRNPNEVKNQMLNAAMYDEIKGLCFYKYSSMLSNNTIVKNGVNLLKNDYWKKNIPGAVLRRYANTLESTPVSNLNYNDTTSKLTWDKLNDVFGYMVYKVPKGVTLDKNNIDHVYQYVQTEDVTITGTETHDIYVASVNRANVISEVTKLNGKVYTALELVIMAIEQLPTTITLDDEETIKIVREKYNSLPSSDKVKVTNYQKLVDAEGTISLIKTLKNKIDVFLKNVNFHITSNYLLPTLENATWSYKDEAAKLEYQITTGEKLKKRLNQHYITLVLTINENGYSYSQDVMFNVGMLSKDMVGLFYRNDASSMSEDDDGAIDSQSPSFIGYANATLTYGNSVLFIAKDNYIRITDKTQIKLTNWTSCAGVYFNATNESISMTISQAFDIESPTYGYFIINSQNSVRYISETQKLTDQVQLAVGETLVIPRYLDGLINSTFVRPIGLKVGESCFLTDYNIEETEEQRAQKVSILISSLPQVISLNDEQLLNNIKTMYDALTEEGRALVTNYDKLIKAFDDLKLLKEEAEILNNYKLDKIQFLNSYLDLTKYSIQNQAAIKQILADLKEQIDLANSKSSVDDIYTTGLTALDEIKTIAEELSILKENIIKEIKSFDLSKYTETNQAKINVIITKYVGLINKATTEEEIKAIKVQFYQECDEIPSIAEELLAYKNQLIASLKKLIDDSIYSEEDLAIINAALQAEEEKIRNCESIELADSQYEASLKVVNQLIIKYNPVEKHKTATINDLKTFIINLSATGNRLKYLNSQLETAIAVINDLDLVFDINVEAKNFKSMINEYIKSITEAANLIKEYFNSLDTSKFDDSQKSKLAEVVNEAITNLNSASSSSELLLIKNGVKNEYDLLLKEATSCKNTNKESINFLISILSISTLFALIFRKK